MTTSTYDLTSSFVQRIDADRDVSAEVLARIDPMRTFADRLSALGLDDRAMWAEPEAVPGERAFRLIWRFDGSGRHATLDWRIRADADAAGRTLVSVRLGARGSDDESRKQLLRSWLLVEELAHGHARSLARLVEDYADADFAEEATRRPALRAVI